MDSFKIDPAHSFGQSNAVLAGTSVQGDHIVHSSEDFADRWITPSMLILSLVPLGLWCWWAVISAIISLF
ncbi:hypothetical protein [Planktotalea sp.]|uniref:hypothetical protein n=1 Tax=Planktotalea sp. TaxID=2029877 RepID=UPI003F6C3426